MNSYEIKPHHNIFKSTFVEIKENIVIVTYDNKNVKLPFGKVKVLYKQAFRNRDKIIKTLDNNFPLISLEKTMEYLYGKNITKGMKTNW